MPQLMKDNQQPIDVLTSLINQKQNGAYQEGVNKALKESGYAHASEAIQQGADPMSIQNHEIMTGNTQGADVIRQLLSSQQPRTNANPNFQNVDPIKLISGLVAMSGNQPNQSSSQTGQDLHFHVLEPKSAFQRSNYTVDDKTGDITLQKGGWLFGGNDYGELVKASMIQKLQGREPIQPYQMLAQDTELSKTLVAHAFRNPDIKNQAIDALSQGQTLPGFSPEQTQVFAGLRNPGSDKVTASDIQTLADMNQKTGILDKFMGTSNKFDNVPQEIKQKYIERFMKINSDVKKRQEESPAQSQLNDKITQVRVLHPDGRMGMIPSSQLEQAKKEGFKLVN